MPNLVISLAHTGRLAPTRRNSGAHPSAWACDEAPAPHLLVHHRTPDRVLGL